MLWDSKKKKRKNHDEYYNAKTWWLSWEETNCIFPVRLWKTVLKNWTMVDNSLCLFTCSGCGLFLIFGRIFSTCPTSSTCFLNVIFQKGYEKLATYFLFKELFVSVDLVTGGDQGREKQLRMPEKVSGEYVNLGSQHVMFTPPWLSSRP